MARPYGLLRAGFPYVRTIGMRRTIDYPVDVAFGDGLVYVLLRAEGAALVRKLSLDDENLGAIASVGNDDGQLQWPVTLIADRQGNLFVSDEALNRISSFSKEGEFLGRWGEHGDGDGQVNGPAGIAFDAEENVYVVDSLNHRIQKFTKEGKFLLKWGKLGEGEGEFNMPWGITVDELGDVYVADWRNDRVQKFTAEGEFVFALGGSGSGDGELKRPSGVDVDTDGEIYVADTGNDRVQLFDETGRYVQKFIGDATLSKSGRVYMMNNAKPMRLRDMANLEPQKRFKGPRSVRVTEGGEMFVPDYGSYRVQIYQKEAIPLDEGQIVPPLRAPTLQTT